MLDRRPVLCVVALDLQTEGCVDIYNRSSAVDANGLMSRGRQANPVLTCETALRRFFCDTSRRVGRSDGDGGRWGEATAGGRLYNRSPRLACLPGVSC